MKKCPRCGHEVHNDEKYCPHCGLDLQGKYKPIKQKNKPMTYLLYVIIFFSFLTIPFLYSRMLNSASNNASQLDEKRIDLPKMEDNEPTAVLATYDTLADFHKQFTNVDSITQAVSSYETTLSQDGKYTYDKKYNIVILDNYNIYYSLTYTAKISDSLSATVERQTDRAHEYNTQKIIFKKNGAKSFEDLFFSEEEKEIVKTFTGEENVTEKLVNDFSKRKEEFEEKKKTLGHYGIGEYDGNSSFVAYRDGAEYYSKLTYSSELSEYIN